MPFFRAPSPLLRLFRKSNYFQHNFLFSFATFSLSLASFHLELFSSSSFLVPIPLFKGCQCQRQNQKTFIDENNFPSFGLFNLKRIIVQNILHNPLLPSLETVQDWCSGFERRSPQSQFTQSTSEVAHRCTIFLWYLG